MKKHWIWVIVMGLVVLLAPGVLLYNFIASRIQTIPTASDEMKADNQPMPTVIIINKPTATLKVFLENYPIGARRMPTETPTRTEFPGTTLTRTIKPKPGLTRTKSPAPSRTPTQNAPVIATRIEAPTLTATSVEWQLVTGQLVDQPTEHFDIVMRFPLIESGDVHPGVGFNQAIQVILDEQLTGATRLAQDITLEEVLGYWFMDYRLTSQLTIQANDPLVVNFVTPQFWKTPIPSLTSGQARFQMRHDLLAVLFETQSFSGSAHMGSKHTSLNYDLTINQILTLEKLFRPGVDYLGELAAACQQALAMRGDDYNLSGADPAASHYQVWNLTQNGILITFEEYQVAPYYLGAQQVLVPYVRLDKLFDPNGPLGNLAK